ncbi:hypothetical protein [Maribacter aquivivus]|uniref:hypothetical protein n=1 Tax=Maribacter aquivivus TaxID=228958 RepID=UPI0024948FBA|nr:hypothetical protein [Maribacter aquivivus]
MKVSKSEFDMTFTKSIPYNVAYLNLSLLDELDYVIGGYGKPNHSFIYTLNSFIETYVLNEVFFFSILEWNHFMITNKSILTKGRPIWSILFKKGDSVLFRDWTGYIESTILYAKPAVKGEDYSQFCIDDFQQNASKEIKEKYFKPAIFLEPDEKYIYLHKNFGFNIIPDDTYLIHDVKRSPKQLLEGLYDVASSDNYQIAMPFNGVKSQLNLNSSLLPSNRSFEVLSKIHNEKIEKLSSYTGYKKIPIPPLVSILLSQCKDLQDIPKNLEQLREDFTELRNSFTELEERIDKAETIKEQMDSLDGLESFWKAFSRKYDVGTNRIMHHFWDVKKSSGLNGALEKVLDSGEVDGFLSNLNASALVGKVAGKTISYFKDKKSLNRFKGMTNLYELFQKSPTLEKQAKDYERIFKVKIDLKELNRLHQMSNL